MRRILRCLPPALAAVALAFAAAPSPAAAQGTRVAVNEDSLRAHLFAISADSMGGRATGSRGDALAGAWIAAQFARAGLEPAGDSGTFYQDIPRPATRWTPPGASRSAA